ncbi:betaine-aldehyde dehydrogenase [Roseomonas rosea]|uniref:Betaine-aldehyde dehydrogenase n=1 Tax=Muricoccus roseus TaxID=198092 RepID=A0A1M6HKC4_9PROT|nr:aldehyde dehydrogenase family protein [Roseomonas rosea]SHJ22615.1 betaine-aldehyde dehydrogenase [Roseomonas rosea]
MDLHVSAPVLPVERGLFYGGAFHAARSGRRMAVLAPATGEALGEVDVAGPEDVDAAVAAARAAFPAWAALRPAERADLLRGFAALLRRHAQELAMVDAVDGGNPVSELIKDVGIAAGGFDFFAGLATEAKGETIPMGERRLNYTLRQPWGVVAKIIAYNHPLMFATWRAAAPLAAGNCVVVKTPDQAPLSALRLMELAGTHFPPGVFSILSGDRETGAALVAHPGVDKIGLVGSVPAGKAVLRAAADRVVPCLLELGGKNALIAYPDADPARVAAGMVKGMNFAWCGQSCGSTSRAFLHASIHDAVLEEVRRLLAPIRPGLPTDPATRMGSLVSAAQLDKVLGYIESAKSEGARLVSGGGRPQEPELAHGFYVEPTVFADVTPSMRIAREEIFGPVLSVLKWEEEAEMMQAVNAVEYGLTASVFTRNVVTAHRAAARLQAGFIWVNDTSEHFLGAPFGGFKQSGLGREESLDELLAYTQVKNVNILLEE